MNEYKITDIDCKNFEVELKDPMVSVTIPTYNEEKTLPHTLTSIKKQTYPNIEIIVVDSNSVDNTKKIAEKFGAKVFNYEGKLLGARYIGVREAIGKYVLLLDADQILEKDAIERAVKEMNNVDMLIFEEKSYKPRTWVEKAISLERRQLHERVSALDPVEGGLLPRFFEKCFIEKVFNMIPVELYPHVVAHDHAIIYYEATKASNKIKILRSAVCHKEETSLLELAVHFYRFGKSTKRILSVGVYDSLISNKSSSSVKNIKYILQEKSITLVLVALTRSIGYRLGYILG